jgi:hypothetical protein
MTGKAEVDAGICGFSAVIIAHAEDMMGNAQVSLKTECPNLKKLGESLEVNIMDLVQKGCGSDLHKKMIEVIPVMHCPCPVTCGLFQAVKIAAGLALPKDIDVVLTKE